jgi:hypothetical protein
MFRQTSRVSYSQQKKGKSWYKHMFGNEWFFSLNERLHATINILIMYYVTCIWQYIYGMCSEFNNSPFLIFFIKTQFATDAQNVLHVN